MSLRCRVSKRVRGVKYHSHSDAGVKVERLGFRFAFM